MRDGPRFQHGHSDGRRSSTLGHAAAAVGHDPDLAESAVRSLAHGPASAALEGTSAFELDVIDGDAWIGVVPFYMTNVTARGLPSVPKVSEFPELNVRTYVRVGDCPGVYFFSLDAGSLFAVHAARTLLNLPYHHASMLVSSHREVVSYESRRKGDASTAALSATYWASGPVLARVEHSLEYFLTERVLPVQRRSQGPAVPAGDPPSAVGAAARGSGTRV